MTGELLQFAASFVAIALLVGAVHLAGYSRPARLADEQEARELASLAPGGFVPTRIALDRGGRGAIAADSAGRLLLLRAHGGQFVPESVPHEALSAEGEVLLVKSGSVCAELRLGSDAAEWLAPPPDRRA